MDIKKRAAQRYVLLIANEEAHVRELMRVADALLRNSDLLPVVFMEDRLGIDKAEALTGRGIEVMTAESVAPRGDVLLTSAGHSSMRRLVADLLANPKAERRIPEWVREKFGWLGPEEVEQVQALRATMLTRAAVCHAVLAQRSWASIVMCEDNVELDTSIWVDVARQFRIQSVIVPYTISNTAEFAESYVGFAPYQVETTACNRIVARLFPAWKLDYKGRQFLRTDCTKIVAVEQLGLAPPNPWLLNSGQVDAIAVESDAMYDYYRAAGIPKHQLVTTGSLADDVLASTLANASTRRDRLLGGLGLTDDRPLLVCALPPDQKTFDRPGCEFADFDDLMEFWGNCLAGLTGWNVVIRPHPKTPFYRVEALRQKGLAVSDEDTAALVPLCDLYLGSVTATIRWAIACGKPVLNYDVYQYGYEDYRGVEGVLLVNTREQFRTTLAAFTGKSDLLERMADVQRRDSARWGLLDGKSGTRVVALLRGESRGEKSFSRESVEG